MKKETYIRRMEKHSKAFDKLWDKIVADTNNFIKSNSDTSCYLLDTKVTSLIDNLSLSGAWIQDRINGKSGVTGDKNYRGSLTKKIRQALGYTF